MPGGVVRYARFLFTRNQQRDFTAFLRPPDMANKDVSAIANAFNFVNDVSTLTPDFPALYCFPLGAYLYILRHYDSGRTHAGRAIPVIEGIAIHREEENALGGYLAEILDSDLLDVAGTLGDINTLERAVSETHDWAPEVEPVTGDDAPPDAPLETDAEASDSLVDELAERHIRDWLLLPFDPAGRDVLRKALADPRLPILHFAFGGNPDVVAQFKSSGVRFDIVGYASVEAPEFRPRDTMKAVDVREILPDAAAEPTQFRGSDAVPPLPDDLADGRTAEVKSGEPVAPIFEERQRVRKRRKRGLLRKIVDALLGR